MYSYEERMEAVKLYIDCGFSFATVRRKLGYPGQYSSLRAWYEEYAQTSELRESMKRSDKYTKEEKRRAIRYYNRCGNISETIRRLHYPSRPILKKWIEERRPEVFADKKTRRPENPADSDIKVKAITDYYVGDMSVTAIADKYNVSRAAIYSWVKKIAPISNRSQVNEDIVNETSSDIYERDSLRAEIYRLRLERDILEETVKVLKKDNGISPDNLTNMEKVTVIDAIRARYTLKEILTEVGMAKSTYMYTKRIKERPDNYESLKERIKIAFVESYMTYGYRRIRECVKKADGRKYSARLIRRLMSEEKLIARSTDKKYSSYRGELSIAPENVVNRDFTADRPNEKWLTDITEFGIPAGKVYLSPVIDCYDGMPVAWSIGTSPSFALVSNMLKGALGTLHYGEKPIIHSDRGWHYRDIKWIKKVEGAGLVRSMSKKGCTADNSMCEAFFGMLKREIFYNRSWVGVSIKKFTEIINGYMYWYAAGRIKETLGGLSPLQYRLKEGVI